MRFAVWNWGQSIFIRKPYNVRIVKGKINSVIKLRESAIVLSALEYDELTGLYIRQAFFHHAKTLMRVKNDQKFHVVVADVKNFKWINGTYGEKTGDQVLAYLGDAYKKQVHSGMVARYGGDQFVAIVYGDLNLAEEKGGSCYSQDCREGSHFKSGCELWYL